MTIVRQASFRLMGQYAWYALAFLQPFNSFGALRVLSATVLLACLVVELCRTRRITIQQAPIRIAVLVVLWSVLASLAGPYPLDSFHYLRRDLLVQALMFASALIYLRTTADAWRIVGVALLGFGTVTVFSFIEVITSWIHNGLSLWVDRSHNMFWGGYGATASVHIPLLVGWLLAAPEKRAWTATGWTTLTIAVLLVVLYGSRTPLIVIFVATTVLFCILRRWRHLFAAGLIVLGVATALQIAPASHLDKYKSLLKGDTYVTNAGLSQRLSVWEGCWQVISERPLLGYGYGWKKLAWVINDGDYARRWQNRPDITSYYLTEAKASYGKVNPHNYPLQVMFEVGIVGLALVLAFWSSIAYVASKGLRDTAPELNRITACLLTALVGYALSNITNGYWVGGQANISILFAGALLAVVPQRRQGES